MSKLIVLDRYKQLNPRTIVKADNRIIRAQKHHMNWPLFKIFAAILAQTDQDSFGRYRSHIKELMGIANLGGANCEDYVIESLKEAARCALVIPDVEDKTNGLGTAIILPFKFVHYNPNTGNVVFELNEHMKSFFLDLRAHFTLFGLEEFKKLASFREGQLFMLMCYCRNLNKSQMRQFPLGWLLSYLDINQEAEWRDIVKALVRCSNNVIKRTGYDFSLRFLRLSRNKRKVTHIQIDIRKAQIVANARRLALRKNSARIDQ